MQNKQPDAGDANDLLIESTNKRRLDRPKKLQSLIDTQAMRFLESMDFKSFNNLSSAFENFMMEAPLFQSDPSFANAAMALDLTAKLFSTIDTDKNHLLSREEFAYLLLKTNDANRQALSWLTENFNAFTQACFFKDQIAKDDIEAARNVFHGLKVVHEKFGFNKQPTLENLQDLDAGKIKDYLDNNQGSLNPHEAAGLKYLLDHIKKQANAKEANSEQKDNELENADKSAEPAEAKGLAGLAGVLDRRSLRTLQGLKLNSFASLFNAFADILEDALSFRGDSTFSKAANAIDTTANMLSELEMGKDHQFTPSELLIVSKLTGSKDKKQMGWFARHFEALTNAFFFPGKAKKKEILVTRNIFHGLSFLRDRLEAETEVSEQELEKQIQKYLANHDNSLEPHNKMGLEALVQFMERHAK